MIVYAESSAVLSWVLGEPQGDAFFQCLSRAEFVVTSQLTLVECDRVFHRAQSFEELDPERVEDHRTALAQAVVDWIIVDLTSGIIERARGPFPEEPIRSLDALHLASALETAGLIPETALLTLDDRVRRCGRALGLALLPNVH